MVNLPARRTDTVTQAIIRRIGEGTFGSTLWGAFLGAIGASLPILISLGAGGVQKWIYDLAPKNAWMSVLAAAISSEPEKKLMYVSGALALQPNHRVAKWMQGQLLSEQSQPIEAETAARQASLRGGAKLPPLFTTPLGAKFVRRIGIAALFILAWVLVEFIQGDTGEGLTILISFLCCTGTLLGAGFLIWLLVQALQKGPGDQGDPAGSPGMKTTSKDPGEQNRKTST
jgi:hypothetical protein